jgi:broad specificity phosphatase PhoE
VTTLLLARHGETDWNRDGRLQGHADTPLNDRGREQARALAEEINGVEVIYSSDLRRAVETAEVVAERLGLEVRVDSRLRERGFGAWEGLTRAEIEASFREDFDRWRKGDGFGADDAETHQAFAARIQAFLEDVLVRHPDETVLVITHGGSIRVVQAVASGLDYLRDRRTIRALANCSVARYAAREGKLTPLD